MDTKAVLQRLTEAHGVSGYEGLVRDIVVEEFRPRTDDVRVDNMGNVIGLKRGSSGPRIMLAGHMDEIGLMVTKVEQGFIRFTQVGGFDVRTLPGIHVLVHAQSGDLPGIVAGPPQHMLPEADRDRVMRMNELFIDTGLDEAEIRRQVRVGDTITINRQMIQLKGDYVAGKAYDNRASVTTIIVCLDELQHQKHSWDVYAVSTVQEEVGLRGAITSAYGVAPDIAVALDVGFGLQPGVGRNEGVEISKGPTISVGPIYHPKLNERLAEVARREEIPFQFEPETHGTGTDAWAIQASRSGIPTALLNLPIRNMHTSVEMISIKTIDRAGRMLARFIASLDDNFLQSLKPD